MSVAAIAVPPPATAAGLSYRRKLLIFGIMAFGQFMALIDVQIVAASLNSIQAGLSAGPDEIAWVQTAYLMAEIVMIPLAAYLSLALSTRWLFTASAVLFVLASLMCGMAWSIQSMTVFRAIQGFVGGAMVPTVFATGFAMFQGKQRAMVPTILGLVSTLAPTLGPSVGGWITDTLDWRWLFFINIVPGLFIAIALPILGKVDEPDLSAFKRIDWLQAASLAVFLGCLQYVLEEGPRNQWFEDPTIQTVAWFSFVGAVVFFERSFFSTMPVVRLSPFRRPVFAMACALNVIVGFGLYAATYLTPIFLGRVRGYSSLDIGTTVFIAGVFMAFGAPLAARLTTFVDQRIVIGVGFSLFAFSCWLMSGITDDWGFWQLFVPQAIRGFSMLLCIVPAVGMALNAVPPEELRYASGLFNLMRNLGGAVGIAMVTTWLQDFGRIHGERFGEALSGAGAGALSQALARLSRMGADAAHAKLVLSGELTQFVTRQSLTLAFEDVYFLMGGLFVAGLILVPFCKTAILNDAPVHIE
ncbi:MAG TPA: DHA2 family efflux MFS transporter permease subunit [Rhizomicrobium sp.]|jgi:DHA2 family multidrug resistance protein|nr:DHA2 family efflux MFS transporter permease subunit [Rhizomicrobium sp.]